MGSSSLSATAALAAGGDADSSPTTPAATEEFTDPIISTKTADTD